MISLFTVASQDQSVHYLAQLFGSVGTVLVPDANAITFGIMGMIFKSLNTTALILGAIIVVQTTVVGLLKTATEGEFLGKQWSSMWVPFRMVFGITTLFPTAAGYSVLQIVLMWIIIQGVGAADSLWTVVMNYVNVFGSPYSTVSLPTTVDVTHNLNTLFASLSCESAAKQTYPITYPTENGQHNYYYCADHQSDPFCQNDTLAQTVANAAGGLQGATTGAQATTNPIAIINAANNQMNTTRSCTASSASAMNCNFGPNGACGSMTFGNYNGGCTGGQDIGSLLQCAGYKAQDAALSWIMDLFYNAAADFALFDYSYLNFYNNQLVDPPYNATPNWITNYCQSKGVDPSNCCYLHTVPQGMTTRCRSGTNDGIFPDANNINNDYTNSGPKAISSLIWPCAIESIVSGNGNDTIACIATPPSNADFIGVSTTYYKNTVNGAIATAMAAYLSNKSNLPPNSWEAAAQSTGWLLAGSYYYKIASANNNNMTVSMPPFTIVPADLSGQNGPNPLAGYRNNVSASANLLSLIANLSANQNSPLAATPAAAGVSQAMGGVAGDIMSSFMGTLTGGGSNPLVAIQSLGEKLMITAQVVYALVLAIYMALLAIAAIDPMALGTGLTENPAVEAVRFLANSSYVAIAAFMGWCFTFGGMLGIYTPLVPYIIFTIGAIGWFIAVIEAMVAAPFIALGILSPSGHDLLGKAEPGLMILFNTFLRPTLMIVGMMAAMLLTPVVVNMVNSGFAGVMSSIDSTPGVFELIVFISAYTTLILSVVNKSFSLIHVVPDRVLTWIGGHAQDSSAGEALGAVKGGTSAAGEQASSSAQSQAAGTTAMGGKMQGAKATGESNAAAQKKHNQSLNAAEGKGVNEKRNDDEPK